MKKILALLLIAVFATLAIPSVRAEETPLGPILSYPYETGGIGGYSPQEACSRYAQTTSASGITSGAICYVYREDGKRWSIAITGPTAHPTLQDGRVSYHLEWWYGYPIAWCQYDWIGLDGKPKQFRAYYQSAVICAWMSMGDQ